MKFHKNTNVQYLFGIFIAGPSKIDVTYEEIPIPESPFQVTAAPGCDASRVRAYGPGMFWRYLLYLDKKSLGPIKTYCKFCSTK